MRISWRKALSLLFYLAGILGWCYVGAYMILSKPLWGLYCAFGAGKFSLLTLLWAAVQVFIYLSLAGGVWCIGYVLSDYFKDKDRELQRRQQEKQA